MIAGSLARRYARALLEIGISKNNFEELGQELAALAAMYAGSRDLVEALTNPVFAHSKRRVVLEAVLEAMAPSAITRNFALLLLDRERIPYLPAIARELAAMVDERAGRARGSLVSARPLLPEHLKQIQAVLERASGKTVILERREDHALLGGVVAKLGDVVYDGSVRTQLDLMREQFLLE